MKTILAGMLLFILAGCSALDLKGQFENRVTCTVDKSQALVVSKWYKLGIASEIADADTKIICK